MNMGLRFAFLFLANKKNNPLPHEYETRREVLINSSLPTLTGWTFMRGVDRLKVSVIVPFKWGLLKI